MDVEYASLVEAVDSGSSSSLTCNGMVAALCPRLKPGAAVHCLPSCISIGEGGCTWAGVGPVSGQASGEVHVIQPDILLALSQNLLLGLSKGGLKLLAPVEGDLGT